MVNEKLKEEFSEQAQEIQELKRKERQYFRLSRIGLYTMAGVAALGISAGLIDALSISKGKPQLYDKYVNATATLHRLKTDRAGLAYKLEVPYETPEVRAALDSVYEAERQKVSELDKAITSVGKDVEEMDKDTELRDYLKQGVISMERFGKIMIGTILGMCGIVAGAVACQSRAAKYRKRVESLAGNQK